MGCSGWYGYYLERYLGLNIAAISLFGRGHFLPGSPPPFYSEQECAWSALYPTHARLRILCGDCFNVYIETILMIKCLAKSKLFTKFYS